jgi:hypothetical protein
MLELEQILKRTTPMPAFFVVEGVYTAREPQSITPASIFFLVMRRLEAEGGAAACHGAGQLAGPIAARGGQ